MTVTLYITETPHDPKIVNLAPNFSHLKNAKCQGCCTCGWYINLQGDKQSKFLKRRKEDWREGGKKALPTTKAGNTVLHRLPRPLFFED